MHLFYRKIVVALSCVQSVLLSCSDSDSPEPKQSDLELVSEVSINISEPSGLAINSNNTALYTVSDNTNKVYKLNLSGSILKTYGFIGNDLEGISYISDSKLLLAEERTKTIVELETTTGNFATHKIDYENSEANSGMEGITYNSSNSSIYILNEKDPGLLMKLNANFSIESTYKLDFASDYSGIYYDTILNVLWIVSDQSKTLNKCTLNGALIKEYSIPITKAEGVVVTNNKIYIVSDSENKLYTFNKPEN